LLNLFELLLALLFSARPCCARPAVLVALEYQSIGFPSDGLGSGHTLSISGARRQRTGASTRLRRAFLVREIADEEMLVHSEFVGDAEMTLPKWGRRQQLQTPTIAKKSHSATSSNITTEAVQGEPTMAAWSFQSGCFSYSSALPEAVS
jgi:hypothetical protein